MANVWIQVVNEDQPRVYADAYLQADDATILIRQKIDGCWTTTAVFAPGRYVEAGYDE